MRRDTFRPFRRRPGRRRRRKLVWARAALDLPARYAKPTDCFVIGMFPKHTEQVRQNCRLVRAALDA